VQAVFNTTKDTVMAAFKERRKEKPALSGTVIYNITVEPDGKVSDSSKMASSTLNDPVLEKQLLDMFKKLDFGKALRPEKFSFQFPVDFPKEGWDKKDAPVEKTDGKSSDKV
jgi:TonB family protein